MAPLRKRNFLLVDLSDPAERAPVAARMAELREQYDATQQECADALGVEQPTYAQMEGNGIRFRRRDLVTLADLFGLPKEEAFPDCFPPISAPANKAA